MFDFFLQQLIFLITLLLTLFVPGFFLLHALGLKKHLTKIEYAVLSVPVSFGLTTFLFLTLGKCGVLLTQITAIIGVCTLSLGLAALTFAKKSRYHKPLVTFSHKQVLLVCALIFFTVFFKAQFLTNTIFPTATDLGHHMFWVQKIIITGEIPVYQKTKVTPLDASDAPHSSASFNPPERIADFIIGEHIIFAIISLITGTGIISAFPSLVLYVVNIFTALAMFTLAIRLFCTTRYGAQASILTLLLIGPLWTISGAGAKFVSGGVIGNILGNLLIVSVLYFIYIARTQKTHKSLLVAILLLGSIIYTHHLSTFILAYALVGILVVTTLLHHKKILRESRQWLSLLLTPSVIAALVALVVFLLMIHVPSYLNSEAVSSSVGAPSKSTRTGIDLLQFMMMSGEARFAFGIFGALITAAFFISSKKICNPFAKLNPYATAIILGWTLMLFAMTVTPHLLKVNIISSRIATYIIFPLAMMAGLFLAWLFTKTRESLPKNLATIAISLILFFILFTGLRDNVTSLNAAPKTQAALQTFHAASYLAGATPKDMWILKDHNYVVADTWIKVLVNTDYSNPLSRAFFQRYENNPNREHCTLEMISDPTSDLATDCFNALTIGPVLVDTQQDAGQFANHSDFIRVYENDDSTIFWRVNLQRLPTDATK